MGAAAPRIFSRGRHRVAGTKSGAPPPRPVHHQRSGGRGRRALSGREGRAARLSPRAGGEGAGRLSGSLALRWAEGALRGAGGRGPPAFLGGFLAFLSRGHSHFFGSLLRPERAYFWERVCPRRVCSAPWERLRVAVQPSHSSSQLTSHLIQLMSLPCDDNFMGRSVLR